MVAHHVTSTSGTGANGDDADTGQGAHSRGDPIELLRTDGGPTDLGAQLDPGRSGDHDPLLVGIDLGADVDPAAPTGTVSGGSWVPPGQRTVFVTRTFHSTSPVAVAVATTTRCGPCTTRTVGVGREMVLRRDSGLRTVPAGGAAVRVTARVDGRDVSSTFPFGYQRRTAPRR